MQNQAVETVETAETVEKTYKPVQSIERVFQIMEILAQNPEGLSLMALSEKTGLHNSTVHRLLHTLYALGYTEWRHSNSSPYKLTLRLFEYGSASVEHRPFVQTARPFLDRLSEELNLSAHLFLPDQSDMMCVMTSNHSSFSGGPQAGTRLPMWCSAAGKCMLAYRSGQAVASLWESRGASLYGPNAPASLAALHKDLTTVQQYGYAFCNEEVRVGLATLGVPLVDQTGAAIGALCISGIPSSFSSSNITRWAETLKQFSESLMSTQN